MNTESNRPGSLMMLASSMLIFGTIGIFRRYIPLSSGLLAFSRGLIGAFFLGVFMKCRGLLAKRQEAGSGAGSDGTKRSGRMQDRIQGRMQDSGISLQESRRKTSARTKLLLILSGALIGFNWILLFEAYNYTTVATATLCYYMQPTIVILLSPLFFKEQLTAKKLVCAILAVLGMFLVSGAAGQGFPQGNALLGILYGLGAAALYAAVVSENNSAAGVSQCVHHPLSGSDRPVFSCGTGQILCSHASDRGTCPHRNCLYLVFRKYRWIESSDHCPLQLHRSGICAFLFNDIPA